MNKQTLDSDIFFVNYLISGLAVIVLVGYFSYHILPKHNELHMGLVTVSDFLGRVRMLYWLVGPSLLTLLVTFVIDKLFCTTPMAFAALISSISSISSVFFAYIYAVFVDTSEEAWMLFMVIPVIQFFGYLLILAITVTFAKVAALTFE